MTASMLLPIRPASSQAAREVRRDTSLRRARTCYGHLAGVAGVSLTEELLARRWMEPSSVSQDGARIIYHPTEEGIEALADRGVEVPAVKAGKSIAFSCIDWTERRPHLGGALGRAIVDALVEGGCVERREGTRVVTITGGLDRWLVGSEGTG